METLTAPYPWFGGKRLVAELVWERFGDVASYNEPFFGSGAVLLGRPTEARVETINDIDCYVANFWRALQADPDEVAFYADTPVNEADLHARHRWLVLSNRARLDQIRTDPNYYNTKVAGWWVHGLCAWIGSGWCQDAQPDDELGQKRIAGVGNGSGAGVHSGRGRAGAGWTQARRPQLSGDQGVQRRWQGGGRGGGSGVHAPGLSHEWKQTPDLSGSRGAAGRGVHACGLGRRRPKQERPWTQKKRPHLSNGGRGDNAREAVGCGVLSQYGVDGLYAWFHALAVRMRRVRVCCYDWKRVLTTSVTSYIGVTGVFLDPPYQQDLRERCYSQDHDISAEVRTWALERGDDPDLRIALCGYVDEHGPFMPASWECVPWKAHGGYSRGERAQENRSQERIWFSPHCLKPGLFSLYGDEP